ncbi:hypothetical protein HK102_008594, partial [Quaeritorhiza haematococci]
ALENDFNLFARMFPKTQHLPEDKLANLVISKLASKAKEKINTYFTQHNLDWTAANIFVALRTAYILLADKTRARRQVWHLEQHDCESTKKYLIRFQDVAARAELSDEDQHAAFLGNLHPAIQDYVANHDHTQTLIMAKKAPWMS